MTSEKKDPLVFLKAKSTKIIIALSCIFILVILSVPLSIRYALQSYLIKNGATDAVISSLSLNPFAGTIKVKGVRVEGAEKRLFASNDFNVDIKLLSLFQKELVIEKAYYDKLTIDLQQQDDGRWRIASYTTPEQGEIPAEQVIALEEVEAPSDWNIIANHVLLTNCVVDFSMPNFSTQVVVEKAELSNLSTKAEDIPARFTFVGSVDGSPLNITLDTLDLIPNLVLIGTIDFQNYDLHRLQKILAPSLHKLGGSLSLNGATELSLGEKIQFSYSGAVNLVKADLDVSDNKITSRDISWLGDIGYIEQANALSLNGDLAFGEMNFVKDDLTLSGKSLALKGTTKISLSENIKIASSTQFESTDFGIKIGTMIYGHKLLSWSGELGYTALNNGTTFAGELKLKELAYSDTGLPLTTQLGSFTWDGKGRYVATKEHLTSGVDIDAGATFTELSFSLPGEMPMDIYVEKAEFTKLVTNKENIVLNSVETGKTSLYSPLLKKDFFKYSELNLGDILITQNGLVTLGSTNVNGITVFPAEKSEKHTGSVANVDLANLQWSNTDGVWIKKISASGLGLQVVRDKQGSLNIGEQIAGLSVPQKSKSKEVSGSEKPSQGSNIRIDRFELKGKNTVFYKDYTLEVPFESESDITSIVLDKLDSKKTQQDSNILVTMLLEKRAPFKLEGTFRPFEKGVKPVDFLKLKYSLKNYPIRNLSSYAVQNVGTALHSGELRLTGDFNLSKGIVDSSNDLALKRLTTKAMSAELAAKVDDKLPIPLNAALALLRDSDDNISLNLPIDGAVDKLNFDVSDAIIIALGKAVVPAISSYLVYALGPYGALAYVGMKVGENVLEVRLPPVKFDPQKIELTVESKDYLKRVGKILNDGKSQSDVQVCPVVSLSYELGESAPNKEEDLELDDKKELEELGQARAHAVREHLINEYGVNEERLLLCITTLEKKGESKVLLHADQ